MNAIGSAILITWKRNGTYAQRLAGDLDAARWLAQPVPGRTMNHPAWIFSHLNLYAGICVALASAAPFEDPAEHRYGQKSEPLPDAAAYASGDELLADWDRLHARGQAALERLGDHITSAPVPLERWRALHPTVGDMLVTLMVKHESGHLGQLSAWRRAMGLARVAV